MASTVQPHPIAKLQLIHMGIGSGARDSQKVKTVLVVQFSVCLFFRFVIATGRTSNNVNDSKNACLSTQGSRP